MNRSRRKKDSPTQQAVLPLMLILFGVFLIFVGMHAWKYGPPWIRVFSERTGTSGIADTLSFAVFGLVLVGMGAISFWKK